MASAEFILGEFNRKIDERFRLSIPTELAEPLCEDSADLILVKERPGCLSLWNSKHWQAKLDAGVNLVKAKIDAGRLEGRIADVQMLGRLLSTRHRNVQLAAKGRLLIPEGFREFLGVEAGGEVLIVGAAICVEIWRTDAWLANLEEQMPEFRTLLDALSN
ncbi:division/cell wall cluster transcriptional repressor MraZ [Blastopirellula marina]|uniref:Transcriptional regulator MraZ n=1 Tax=Blastopirellula marina TaxID=124 RepID=A0A2S8F3Q6_9BACT|nr:division/cell wall cluster transcriptional repressor MraZ [Blastopirellula marina]PQO26795.1 division/cell wall cluster transcriptional repressor MraZ [Blastopirellula marina]PQO41483.1 division/cell wall cluster transcriptional repressor MraZ [Blastopirellula marina]PTL41002.1 division/cell wall cluster transcriptional repressor MraZ [Blastopirellula marina]